LAAAEPPPIDEAREGKLMGRKISAQVRLLRFINETAQRMKFSVIPNHFYSEIPDIRQLRRDQHWRAPMTMVGVDIRSTHEQSDMVGRWVREISAEEQRSLYEKAWKRNGEIGYGPIEAVVLAGFIRNTRPPQIVQVGCGVSTAIIQDAANAAGFAPRITCVEPYPTRFLRAEAEAGRITLHAEPAQTAPMEVFTALRDGDLLFIDSTHTVHTGSEVVRIVLEVLPRLSSGVWVHFHDINFPYDYSPGILSRDIFFNRESTLLHAFLAMNDAYRIELSLSMVHHQAGDTIQRLFPGHELLRLRDGELTEDGAYPSATYLRRVR
jgi:hypothetical protein